MMPSRWSGRVSSARTVVRGFFPLDDRLGLLRTSYSPFVLEAIVRLGTLAPFEQVPEEVAFFMGVVVSADTVRRLTEEAGRVQQAIEDERLEDLEQEAPPEPVGPAVQQVSADGMMIS